MKLKDTADTASAADQLERMIERFSPEIAREARAALVKLRALLPGAVEMVYDNYYALVIGFCPVERASEAILSVALYPRWMNLNFLVGDALPDPGKLLRGSGKINRHLRLENAATLDREDVKALIKAAIADADVPLNRRQAGRIVIAGISPRRRPRRP